MTRFPFALGVPALVLLALTACTAPAPGGEFTPTNGPAIADESATPDIVSSQKAENYAPPAQWTHEELVGACKVEGDLSATGRSWEDFSSDPTFEETLSGWSVTFPSLAGANSLRCDVSGTPESARVVIS